MHGRTCALVLSPPFEIAGGYVFIIATAWWWSHIVASTMVDDSPLIDCIMHRFYVRSIQLVDLHFNTLLSLKLNTWSYYLGNKDGWNAPLEVWIFLRIIVLDIDKVKIWKNYFKNILKLFELHTQNFKCLNLSW
jgi:hypothetical protein